MNHVAHTNEPRHITLKRICFVSTTMNSMKCLVDCIPLRIHVRSRNTQPHLKSQVSFRKRATDYRALLRKMTCQHKASYESLHITRSLGHIFDTRFVTRIMLRRQRGKFGGSSRQKINFEGFKHVSWVRYLMPDLENVVQ